MNPTKAHMKLKREVWMCVFSLLLVLAMLLISKVADAEEKIIGIEHKVTSVSAYDGKPLTLYVWEKYRQDVDPQEFTKTGKVVLLAHGATWAGRVDFDVQVPEATGLTHSLMDHLAMQGFDVFSVDYQNYGRSDQHSCGLCVTTQVAANDINAAVDHIRSLRSVEKVYLLGWSWGSATTGLFTIQKPHKVRRLILYAPYLRLKPDLKPPTTEFRVNTEKICADLFEPEATNPGVSEAFCKEALQGNPQSPNGVLMDFRTRMPLTDARQIPVPTMIIFGDLDRLTPITQTELPGYFADLPHTDKQLIIVPGGGHALMLQKPRLKFFIEVVKWFSLDQPEISLTLTTASQ
ncbi:MAG: lysophospholipase [Nitrospira sp.]|nr:lysophospholipase [Nitrospira sp.]